MISDLKPKLQRIGFECAILNKVKSIFVYNFLEMCTGSYIETATNEEPTPPGTKCVGPCLLTAGKWGSSYCYTTEDQSQWGVECVSCSGKELNN